MKARITEDMNVHEQWYVDARSQTLASLPAFLSHLTQDYQHDYGTICHAVAAAGLAAMHAINSAPQGGITGFQSGAVIWEVIRAWGTFPDGPKRMVSYDDMLYPQSAHKFAPTITKDTWFWLQGQARKHLLETQGRAEHVHPDVRAHWEFIQAGIIPFGYTLEQENSK